MKTFRHKIPPQPTRHEVPVRSHGVDSVSRLMLVYFCSGLPALLYQTVWQRVLVLHSGVGTTSVAIIVAVFLLGLGLGSLAGARLCRRISPRKALIRFAILEIAVALFAALSPTLMYDFLYLRYGWLYSNLWLAGFLHAITLLPPTVLMGMTLPLMSRALVRDGSGVSSSVSLLYGINTMGAALGALLGPWVLMPFVGVRGVCSIGASLNLLIALSALSMRGSVPDVLEAPMKPTSSSDRAGSIGKEANQKPVSFATWIILYFLSGLIAIGLEIVWFRILDVAVKSTAYTFGTVLATYLASLAVGSMIGARRDSHIKDPLRTYLWIQCWIMVTAALPLVILHAAPSTWLDALWIGQYWADPNILRPAWNQIGATVVLYAILPLIMMATPTCLMGYGFAVLQRGVQIDARNSGYRVGIIQAANILGCTIGSLLVGLGAIGFIGTANTLRLLIMLGSLFALLGWYTCHAPRRFSPALGLILAMAFCLPTSNTLWQKLHGLAADSPATIFEDVTGVAAITPEPGSSKWRVSANGKSQSDLPFGGFHSKLGALPTVMHSSPKDIAIIGLGSGDTAWAASCRQETEAVTVFEICTAEEPALRAYAQGGHLEQLANFLRDSRITIDGRDARHVLMTDPRKYDIIEADAIRPWGAFAGYLYSIEFFQLCRQRLKPNGLMCNWVPTMGTYSTFCEVFPYVLELDGGFILIGSNDPIPDDLRAVKVRLQSETISRFLGPQVVRECLDSLESATGTLQQSTVQLINTDLFPFDEFRY